MDFKAAIFDLDGTLLDSLQDLYLTMREVLTLSGYPPIEKEQVRKLIGNGARDFMKYSLPPHARQEENVDLHLDVYHRTYKKYALKNTRPYPFVEDILIKLKKKNIKIAVLSNKPHYATVRVVERFFPHIEFDAVLGQKDDFPPKPDIASAIYLADVLSVEPDKAAFIGDGETDTIVALKAGFYQIAALWGYRTREELEAVGAENFAATPRELYGIFGIEEN
jgi:phosphoglycolate phosphatase